MTAPAVSWFPGHGDRPTGWDTGTISRQGWTEADVVRRICAAAWLACEARHVPSEICAAGSYSQRGQDAEAGAGSRLVVQVHVNAGAHGRDEGLVFYWPTNDRGPEQAEIVAAALRPAVPWPVRVEAADHRWPNVRACLASVATTSILVEVGFADGVRGAVELPGLADAIGQALGSAV